MTQAPVPALTGTRWFTIPLPLLLLLLWTSISPTHAGADPQPPLSPNSTWEGRPQFWRVAEVDWSPPEDAVYANDTVQDAHQCLHLCLRDRSCAAADLVTAADGLLSCRLAARRGSGTALAAGAGAAFVRLGHAEFSERCLTDDECWQGSEGAGCVDGVCACSEPALTARGECTISDCTDLPALGITNSGQYWVRLEDGITAAVFCDMATGGGGWTVFQRRQDDAEQLDFYRYWHHYRDGFGSVSGQFWLGNELIHRLTSRGAHQLRVDLEDFDGNTRFAKYNSFSIAGEDDLYRLSVYGYSGDAGDSFSFQNNGAFSTKDRDNDRSTAVPSCSRRFKGGWWYIRCHRSNLNGYYWRGPFTEYASGVSWYDWRRHQYSLKHTEMKFRPEPSGSATGK